ncbi:HNH endonuclease [Stutzerimonas nitrititolerans]|uniref:HNH endonuclease n=1 Tax=Stutzerimonas nitrititolerans TaxID=2482751 RepID=UPI0028AED09C|nr:HNH endonuclease [Stutzerimonas nitrititolerans]
MAPFELGGAQIKDIPDAPLYSITDDGRVISYQKGAPRVLTHAKNNNGYAVVGLVTNSGQKNVTVHRLVAEAFIPNPSGKPQVNHKDSNRMNPRADNLEWVTAAENKEHSMASEPHLAMLERNAKRRAVTMWLTINPLMRPHVIPRVHQMADVGLAPHEIVKAIPDVSLKKGYSKTLSNTEKAAIRAAGFSYQ